MTRFMRRVFMASAVVVASGVLSQSESMADVVEYEVVFQADWSAATHPVDFPGSAHFSGLIGGTHNDVVSFWNLGGLASPGIESMAETGSKTLLTNEVQAAIGAGAAYSVVSGGAPPAPGSTNHTFDVSASHPNVTLVSMIAPSPDWFVGVSGLSLHENGEWLDGVVVDLAPYDSGTDSGTTYASANQDTDPQDPIADISNGFPFTGTPPIGTFTFNLITTPCPGDIDGDGLVGLADLAILLAGYNTTGGATYAMGDLNGDGNVDLADLAELLAAYGTVCA